MDNTFYTQDNIAPSSEDESEEEDYSETRFSNMVKKKRYVKYRNKLFTPDIELYMPEYIKPYFLLSSS